VRLARSSAQTPGDDQANPGREEQGSGKKGDADDV
jgi:hypothetical protein